MEADIREIKRAKNFIWASAEDYELNPLYLAFHMMARRIHI